MRDGTRIDIVWGELIRNVLGRSEGIFSSKLPYRQGHTLQVQKEPNL